MTKILRLGFVMGGGVSLGTFSGAALTEIIKQQLVYGQYDTGQKDDAGQAVFAPYDKVVLDVFSGASAGAISLAIMIRILANPRDKFKFLGYDSYLEMRERLEEKLQRQFASQLLEIKEKYPQKYEDLLAAQTAQDFQEKVWVKEANINRLLGVGWHQKDLRNNASFLDRDMIDKLGEKIFPFKGSDKRLEHRSLLGDRILFACTLANLSHSLARTQTDSTGIAKPSLLQALNDSSIDRIHSELRVFDINFDEIKAEQEQYYPLQWVQYHQGEELEIVQKDHQGNSYKKRIISLNSNDSWRELTATAIASGAVPFAFEPVVLHRYRYEYGAAWASRLAEEESYPFTYIDGGIFNNEPIKEAMNLVSYMDTIGSEEDFERQLIFVDPKVSDLERQYRMALHENIAIGRSMLSGQYRATPKSTIFRIASQFPAISKAVLNEAKSVEMPKVSAVIEKFERRKILRNFYKGMLGTTPPDLAIIEMRTYITKALEEQRNALNLPSNTLQIQHEFIRVCKEESEFLADILPLNNRRLLVDQINEFVFVPKPSEVKNAAHWVFVLSCLSLDIAMGLVAKQSHVQLIPIAPFDFYNKDKDYTLMKLPGGSLAGFAGFASVEASLYEVAYGQYTAMRVLQELGLIKVAAQSLPLPPPFNYRLFDTSLKDNLKKAIIKRIKEILPNSFATIMPFLEGYLSDNIQQLVHQNLEDNITTSRFEFRIQVPNNALVMKGFEKGGRAYTKKNLKPINIDGAYYFVVRLDFDFDKNKWKGDYINFMQKIYIDKEKLFEDVPVLGLELPPMSLDNPASLSPNPIFNIDARASLSMGGYTELTAKKWDYISAVKALDKELWSDEK